MGYHKDRRPGLQPGGPVATEGDIPAPPTPGVQATVPISADHALVLADLGKLVLCDADELATLTIADEADVEWPDGAFFDVAVIGAGPLAVEGAEEATVIAIDGSIAQISELNGTGKVRRLDADYWVISGDLDAEE